MNILTLLQQLAYDGHKGQFRRDGVTPYISHPLAVQSLIREELSNLDNREYGILLNNIDLLFEDGVEPFEVDDIILALAVSHDLVEDAEYKGFTLDFIRKQIEDILGFDIPRAHIDIFIQALDAITKRKNEAYLDYILRVKQNPIARFVKIFDITHNVSTRNDANTAGDKKRDKIAIDKYSLAKFILLH